MMFEQNFMPEGAEINPDTPRKKGLARLFEILSRDLDGIFLSGALAMLVCVPAAILAGIALWLGSLPLCLLAAVAAGADGLLVEVHDRPATALSDGAQALTPAQLTQLAEKTARLRAALA